MTPASCSLIMFADVSIHQRSTALQPGISKTIFLFSWPTHSSIRPTEETSSVTDSGHSWHIEFKSVSQKSQSRKVRKGK